MPSFGVTGVDPNDAIKRNAHVSANGELLIREYAYSEPYSVLLAGATSTLAKNLVEAKASDQFVVTGVIFAADRNIGPNGANITLYESTAADSTVQAKVLFEVDILKQTNFAPPLPDTGILARQGFYLNVDRDATAGTVRAQVFGYFIPTIE
jgi:hypothetical protein